MKKFSTVRQKLCEGKTSYPLLWIKVFNTPNFLKFWREAHKNFQHCEAQNFRRKNIIPPVMQKIFRHPNLLKPSRDANENFRHCETWRFRRKNVIPPFSSKKLFETWNFLKNSGIPSRNFSALWDIKISTGNRDMSPPIHNFFAIPEISWKTESFLYKEFRFSPVRQKKIDEIVAPSPLLCMTIFHKRVFLKHHSVLQWNILKLSDKNFSTEKPETPYYE